MLARSFPLNSKNIMQEAYLGMQDCFHPNQLLLILLLIEAALLKLLHKENKVQLGFLRLLFHKNDESPKIQTKKDYFYAYLSLMYVFFGAPLIEEIVFRGVLTPTLEKIFPKIKINSSYAAIVSSILFGCIHPDGQKISSAYVGFKLEQLTKINNGSLWGNIAKHSTLNLLAFLPPPILIALGGLIIEVSALNDKIKKLNNANEEFMLQNASQPYRTFYDVLIDAINGAKLGATAALWLIPLIIQFQIKNNKNFTSCITGSLKKSASCVSTGASIGTTLGIGLNAGVCFFSHRFKMKPKLIVENADNCGKSNNQSV